MKNQNRWEKLVDNTWVFIAVFILALLAQEKMYEWIKSIL